MLDVLRRLIHVLEALVSGLDDLNANVAAQTTALGTLTTSVDQLAGQAGDSDIAVEAAAQSVAANTATIATIQQTVDTALGTTSPAPGTPADDSPPT